eukprot:1062317-Lingulodinium_polyedra.AAC.1
MRALVDPVADRVGVAAVRAAAHCAAPAPPQGGAHPGSARDDVLEEPPLAHCERALAASAHEGAQGLQPQALLQQVGTAWRVARRGHRCAE